MAAAHGWPVVVQPLPPLLHNRPQRIAGAVAEAVLAARQRFSRVAVAYADCGSYGELGAVCDRLGVARLHGAHCYDVYAGEQRYAELMREEPGTYLLTDFLAASFHRSVVVELGIDRYPELVHDYFRHYRRVVWLTQRPTAPLREAARRAAALLGLPLVELAVGDAGLADQLARLVAAP